MYKKYQLQSTLLDFIQQQDNGFYPFDPVTGQGKTYSSIDFSKDVVNAAISILKDKNAYILFVTSNKINLPEDEISKYPELKNKYCYIPSFDDNIKSFFNKYSAKFTEKDKDILLKNVLGIPFMSGLEKFISLGEKEKKIGNALKNSAKNFLSGINAYIKLSDETDKLLESYANTVKEETRKKEGIFRTNLKTYLRKRFKKAELEENFTNSSEFEIIRELYPAHKLTNNNKYKFIMMTVSRLINPIDTIISGVYDFSNIHEVFPEKSRRILFIDEMDKAFETIAEHRYEKAANNSVGMFKLMRDICNIHSIKLPKGLISDEKFANYFDTIKKISDSFIKKYPNFKNTCVKVKDEDDDLLLMKDSTTKILTDIKKEGKKIVIKYNESEIRYEIYYKDKALELEKEEELLTTFLNNIIRIIAQVSGNINMMALRYLSIENTKRKLKSAGDSFEKMQKEDALATVLDLLKLINADDNKDAKESAVFNYFNNKINSKENVKHLDKIIKSCTEFSYFNEGFEIYKPIKLTTSNEYDDISCISLTSSVENMIIEMSRHMLVVGMSATLLFDTTINNINTNYIKEVLGDSKVFTPDEESIEAIKEYYNEQTDYSYEGVINNIIDINDYKEDKDTIVSDAEELIENLFDKNLQTKFEEIANKTIDFNNKKEIESFVSKLKKSLIKDLDDEYERTQFFINVMAIKKALENRENSGKVYFNFNSPGYNTYERVIFKNNLIHTIVALCIQFDIIKTPEKFFEFKELNNNIFFLTSDDIRSKNNDSLIKIKAGLGEYIFVITSYASVGAGQNFDYPVPWDDITKVKALNEDERNKVNKFKEEIEKRALSLGKNPKELYESYFNNEKYWEDGRFVNSSPEVDGYFPFVDISNIFVNIPTNIIPNLAVYTNLKSKETLEKIDKIKRLEGEGGISQEDLRKKIYEILFNKSKGKRIRINDSFSVKNCKLRSATQALGRGQRKKLKYSQNNILLPKKFLIDYSWDNISFQFADNKIIEDIIIYANKITTKKDKDKLRREKEQQDINSLIIGNKNSGNRINYLVTSLFENSKGKLSPEDEKIKLRQIDEWEGTRKLILQNPTLDSPNFIYKGKTGKINLNLTSYYMKKNVNKYSYKATDNGSFVDVRDIKFGALTGTSDYKACSSSGVCLNYLVGCKEIKKEFMLQDIPYIWEPKKYIMHPSTYNQLYKGALGELLQEIIFKIIFSRNLEELDVDFYEKFDHKLRNIYLDAKYHTLDAFESLVLDDKNKYIDKLLEVSPYEESIGIIINYFPHNSFKNSAHEEVKMKEVIIDEKHKICFIPILYSKRGYEIEGSDINLSECIDNTVKEKIKEYIIGGKYL